MPASSTGDEPKLRSATAARQRLLLMLIVAEVQRASRGLSPLLQWMIGLALAMAASQLIERFGPFDGFEDLIVREVARQRELKQVFTLPDPEELQVQQIEVSAQARVATLEQREGVAQVVERLGGVAPIRRGAMAEVITGLAERLPAPSPDKPRIVAIDVDLAPLEGGATTDDERRKMLNALTGLREKAHVLVIVLPRPAAPSQLREDRNAFMRDAQCTRLGGTGAGASRDKPLNALFFASPLLFHQTGSYPTKFPHRLGGDDEDIEVARQVIGTGELPPYYPALGTLIHLQFTHRLPHLPVSSPDLTKDQVDERLAARQTLTALCEQAHAPGPGGELLEDRMATPAAATVVKAYRELRFSWRLLDDPLLQHTTIDGADSLRRVGDVHDALFERQVLLLGIDGGASYDKFGIAGIVEQEVSGASLHALQALSIGKPVSPLGEKLIAIGLDVLLAALYSLSWYVVCRPVLKPLRARMPVLGGWLMTFVPLALGVAFSWACFKLVAIGMEVDLWINPIYIVAGILLGIYMDAWEESEAGSDEERQLRHRLFGLPAAREALRSGFGQRIEQVQFAASSGYSTITGLDELRAHAAVVRKRLGPVALTDAVLSAVLRVVVLCWGWALIAYELFKAGSA